MLINIIFITLNPIDHIFKIPIIVPDKIIFSMIIIIQNSYDYALNLFTRPFQRRNIFRKKALPIDSKYTHKKLPFVATNLSLRCSPSFT